MASNAPIPPPLQPDELKVVDASGDIASAVSAGMLIGDVRTADRGDGVTRPFVVVPAGGRVHEFLNECAVPARKAGKIALYTPASFIAYVNRFKDADSVVFVNRVTSAFNAVLDYHREGQGQPRHGVHRATFACRQTEDWKRWLGKNRVVMSQAEFAEFLEDNLHNIADPAGTVILGLATNLSVKKDVAFRQATRLQDGQTQLLYEENIEAAKGDMKLPERFLLGLEPYEGAGQYKVEARLRYRITEGKLALWFDLLRPDKVLEAAHLEVLTQIQHGLEDTVVLDGTDGQ